MTGWFFSVNNHLFVRCVCVFRRYKFNPDNRYYRLEPLQKKKKILKKSMKDLSNIKWRRTQKYKTEIKMVKNRRLGNANIYILRNSRLLFGRLNTRFSNKAKSIFWGQILIILWSILRSVFLIPKMLIYFN